MKNNILTFILALFVSCFTYSQNTESNFSAGDVYTIGNVNHNNYIYINFPRPNFIIKKGGIVNYNTLKGKKVVITSVKEKRNGKRLATIKLVESRKFFNSHKFVTVDIDKAIKNKELVLVKD